MDFSFRKMILSWTRTKANVELISTKGAEVNPYLLFSWCLKSPDLKPIVCLDQATQYFFYYLRWCHTWCYKLVRPHWSGHRVLSPRARAQVGVEDEVWCPGRCRRTCPNRRKNSKLVIKQGRFDDLTTSNRPQRWMFVCNASVTSRSD